MARSEEVAAEVQRWPPTGRTSISDTLTLTAALSFNISHMLNVKIT